MLARYMLSSCVRLSVRRRYCIKTAKCRITQYTAIAERLLFSDAKNLGEISMGSPPTGSPNRGGVGSNGDFRPISRYISETVQDRDIVTMER